MRASLLAGQDSLLFGDTSDTSRRLTLRKIGGSGAPEHTYVC